MIMKTHPLRTFAEDTRASVALTFAVMLTTLLIAGGIAVDYSRSLNVHTSLQNDLDAALLAGATQSDKTEEIREVAQMYVADNWRNKFGITGNVEIIVDKPEESVVRGRITVQVPTTLMAIAGVSTVPVSVASEIQMAGQNLEVALVLDVTDSMAGPKIEALKQSATELVERAYENESSRDHVRIALVPFADYVNVGEINRNANWIDVPLDTETTSESCIDNYREVTGTTNCRMETYSYDRDGVTVTGEQQICDYEYGPPTTRCFTTTYYNRWYGCAASRDYPLDVKDEQWEVRVPGAMNVACGTPGMELTNDDAALKQRISEITTFGNTYIPAGLFWGWTVLSQHEPFSTAKGYNELVDGKPIEKIMVLMTDGANTRSPNYVAKNHSGNDVAMANSRTAELCTNVKSQQIKVYTVAFDVIDENLKDMLRDCASSPQNFYDAEDATELQAAFANIGANLSPLRIAR
ncbi:MAG: hypothetical protein C0519_09315 [Hyphomicrobium sp.]|nr:hypothetical protein [Hyphomicrobium sp.]PPD09265.1 MAG: hypothetical protein CTY28_00095 [Hyphomicrobium sp.]